MGKGRHRYVRDSRPSPKHNHEAEPIPGLGHSCRLNNRLSICWLCPFNALHMRCITGQVCTLSPGQCARFRAWSDPFSETKAGARGALGRTPTLAGRMQPYARRSISTNYILKGLLRFAEDGPDSACGKYPSLPRIRGTLREVLCWH